jgi:hypothetical protein
MQGLGVLRPVRLRTGHEQRQRHSAEPRLGAADGCRKAGAGKKNYRLDAVQTDFFSPMLLINWVIEGENAGIPADQASCIVCHAVSSVKSDGTDGITLLHANPNPVGDPQSLPSGDWIRRDFVWSLWQEARVIDICHEIKATIDRVFAALEKRDELKTWRSAHVGGLVLAGVQQIQGSSKPGFQWKVTELSPPEWTSWACVAGRGVSIGTTALFELAHACAGRTPVTCAPAGWPGNDRKCNLLRGMPLPRLKQDAGMARPAFP